MPDKNSSRMPHQRAQAHIDHRNGRDGKQHLGQNHREYEPDGGAAQSRVALRAKAVRYRMSARHEASRPNAATVKGMWLSETPTTTAVSDQQ